LPKITQVRDRSTERSGHLPKMPQLRNGSTESFGNLPKITQLIYASTKRSGNLPRITQPRCGAERCKATCLTSHRSDTEAQRS